MPVLNAQSLSKIIWRAGIFFSDVSFFDSAQEPYRPVGPTLWKTTLLRILIGEEEASSGKRQTARTASRSAIFRREARLDSERFAVAGMPVRFSALLDQQAELHALEEKLGSRRRIGRTA